MSYFEDDESKSKSNKRRARENQERGRLGEEAGRRDLELMGYKVIREGTLKRGGDFRAIREGALGTSLYTVEVKTGRSVLSPNQREAQRKMGKRYVIIRPDSDILD